MSVYIIEQAIAFDTDVLTLKRLDAPATNTILSAAAARCLILLIEAAGETVGRDQLIHAGWGALGQIVTENSLNQAITQLRKALKDVALDGDLILTVPRAGYKVSRLFSIVARMREEVALSEAPEKQVATEVTSARVTSINEVVIPKKLFEWRAYTAHGLAILLVMISTVSFIVFNRDLYQQLSVKYHEIQYIPTKTKFAYLNVFINQDIGERVDYLSHAVEQLESDRWLQGLIGPNMPYVYINGSYNKDVFSYFLCREEILNHPESCTAYTSLQEGVLNVEK